MSLINTRRRFLAGVGALGVTAFGGVGRAVAEVRPCEVSFLDATFENRQTNYRANAGRAEFSFLAEMKTLANGTVLFAPEQGGEISQGLAAIKAIVARGEDGTLRAEKVAIQWPITALKVDGQLHGVIAEAHAQQVPVGIILSGGGGEIGEIIFEPGVVDPNSDIIDFNAEVSAVIHDTMMARQGMSVRLVAGGTVFSTVQPETRVYAEFIERTLLPAMDEARRKDTEEGCETLSDEEMDLYMEALEDCFLTSACCAVIGLNDRCWELETLRRFRDGWLSSFEAGRRDIVRYYREAPAIAQRLIRTRAGHRALLGIYWRYILPSAVLARIGANRAAYALYRRMMLALLGESRS